MSAVVVRPVRFTDDVKAMQAFLEAMGLRPRIEAEAGGWVDMVAGGGMVALHSAASSATGGKPGQTSLSFEADDLTSLANQLREAGCEGVSVHDEAYGKVLTCSDPLGQRDSRRRSQRRPLWVPGPFLGTDTATARFPGSLH